MRWLDKDTTAWHRWFAWYPVRIGEENVWLENVWLEWVERRAKHSHNGEAGYTLWYYRNATPSHRLSLHARNERKRVNVDREGRGE